MSKQEYSLPVTELFTLIPKATLQQPAISMRYVLIQVSNFGESKISLFNSLPPIHCIVSALPPMEASRTISMPFTPLTGQHYGIYILVVQVLVMGLDMYQLIVLLHRDDDFSFGVSCFQIPDSLRNLT